MVKKPKKRSVKHPAEEPRFIPEMRVFDSFADADQADLKYWRSKTPAARLRECERLRQFNYDYGQGKPLPRFQRVLRVIELGGG
jgi:hypothetical protein